jgi:hypothetical protein
MKEKVSKCNKHNRIRITPENWQSLLKLKARLGLTMTTPALANDLLGRAIAKKLIE